MFLKRCYHARPADPEHPASPWFLWPQEWDGGALGNGRAGQILGPSDYHAHLGANTGGANGVYWVDLVDPAKTDDPSAAVAGPAAAQSSCAVATVTIRNLVGRAKRRVPMVEDRVEPDLVYPLLRWADVARYHAVPSAFLILAQDPQNRRGIDEAVLRDRCPATHAYLRRFQEMLAGRAAYRRYQEGGPFYSMYDVGPYTLAPIKVVWRRMDRGLNAAVVEERDDSRIGCKPVIPQETCVLVATPSTDEAHYLCALLNSVVVGFLAEAHNVRGGKSFGTPSMLDYLRLRRFDPNNSVHAQMSAASRLAHVRSAKGMNLTDLQQRIDTLAGSLWDLGPTAIAALQREIRVRPQPLPVR